MKFSTDDFKNILVTATCGFAAFATLAVGNTLVRRKFACHLKIEAPNLIANSEDSLLVLLLDVEECAYDHDPVAYIRLVDSCDHIIKIRTELMQQKTTKDEFLNVRIDIFLEMDRIEESLMRLRALAEKAESISCLQSLTKIEKMCKDHKDLIYILTIDKS